MSLIHRIGSILVTITVITVGVIGSTSVGATAKAVPEFIDLTDDDVRGESGQALAAAQDAFRNTFTDGEFERALEHAKSMVTLTSELFGPQSVEVSQSLTNLGLAQAEAGDLEAARLNFESALRIREQAERSLVSPGLINPLRGMASVSVDMAELETALVLYERVIHVSHVTDGPTNLEQVDDMDALSRIHYDLENIREANRIQGKIYRLKQRKLAGNADAYIDALDDYAQWFSDTGNLSEAAFKYRLLERAIVDAHGPDSVRLIPTLIELAFIYS
ncbi:MAG: tetratricopeptide repeat protein, partial [Pseudomonadota bacterium]